MEKQKFDKKLYAFCDQELIMKKRGVDSFLVSTHFPPYMLVDYYSALQHSPIWEAFKRKFGQTWDFVPTRGAGYNSSNDFNFQKLSESVAV